jgi:hypothetical protein
MKQLREQLEAEKNEIILDQQQQGQAVQNEITLQYENRLRPTEERLQEVNAILQHFMQQ